MAAKSTVLVIALDSATFDILNPLLQAGELPNVRSLIENGVSSTLESTIPPLSPAAWVTTLTGLNPGAHGVFDFRHLDLSQIHGRAGDLVSSGEFAGQTLFDILGLAGLRIGAFNIPMTYPPWPVNGIMVSGPVTPDLTRPYTYPSGLARRLGPMGKHSSPEHLRDFEADAFIAEMAWVTRRHFEYGLQLFLEEGPFDLFWFHLHTLDSIQHTFWPIDEGLGIERGVDKTRQQLSVIEMLYRMADEGIGLFLDQLDSSSMVIVLSDHGARGRPSILVRPNVWLQEVGLQVLDQPSLVDRCWRKVKRRLPTGDWQSEIRDGVNWPNTRAHFFPLTDLVGGIVINLENRQPFGRVPSSSYESERNLIIGDLSERRDPRHDLSIVDRIWRREEIYRGQKVEAAPDILFSIHPKYYLSGAVLGDAIGPAPRLGPRCWRGIHDRHGILIAKGSAIKRGHRLEDASLLNIAPTIFYALNQPIPDHLDGHILQEMFEDGYRTRVPIKYQTIDEVDVTHFENTELSHAEEASMIERLRKMGYVESSRTAPESDTDRNRVLENGSE